MAGPTADPRWRRRAAGALLLLGAAGLAASAPVLLPETGRAWRLRAAADDPAALASLRLAAVADPERIGAGLDAAVAAGDEDLARSFMALAEERNLPVSPERRAAVQALTDAAPRRALAEAATGFVSGEGAGMAGLAGAVAGDLVGYGDLRDLWREGGRLARGEAYDPLLLGLATAGLALTGATIVSLGTSVPVHAGTTTLKLAARTGKLSRPLAARLTRSAGAALDREALALATAAAGRLDLAALRQGARSVLRPGALREIRSVGEQSARIQARLGARGTLQALAVAENADDLRRVARLSEGLGGRTRAVLALLGRGALVLGSGLLVVLQGLWLGLAWFLAAALFCRRAGTALGRLIWRRPRRAPGVRRLADAPA
ncbi:hypothetical protein SAMN02799631_02463 [Methylobacterium sp. 174MFSha1.1]|uniref:hypothetical protein n=1 Tax=Methylobacterium sp. 174MFSha1.1 TaxID=1502749 RepID=UPI0008DFDC09|nr:hypothetical protein [Methylobacterium sp. 174MFSha1.1]SFU81948.1 hypothetical protein SAMN02799631_02463 [Methylobacterium sp. 174MFSha1.1]